MKRLIIILLLLFLTMTSIHAENTTDTFNNLQTLINDAPYGSTINLTKDYSYSDGSTEGVEITQDITINGNNHILDGKSQSRIFNVQTASVTLTDIIFMNGYSSTHGGAIYMDNGNINNCTFINNKAKYSGGAICGVTGFINVTSSTFISNTAEEGGAIYLDGGVNDSTFIDNSAGWGGAIFQSSGFCDSSQFENNTARVHGGAIDMLEGIVESSTFISNRAGYHGGAVNSMEGEVFKSTFISNQATHGGAVSSGFGSVTSSTFISNHAIFGGAIEQGLKGYYAGYTSHCDFINNSADYGGAIYQHGGIIRHSNFENNTASRHGGAIYQENGEIEKCTFKNNTPKNIFTETKLDIGGSIYFEATAPLEESESISTTDKTGNPLMLLLIVLITPILTLKFKR